MFKRQILGTPGGKRNTEGTVKYKTRTSHHSRIKKIRASLASSKVSRVPVGLYEQVMLPDLSDVTEVESKSSNNKPKKKLQLENEWISENILDFHTEMDMMYTTLEEENPEWHDFMEKVQETENKGYPPGISYLWKESKHASPKKLRIDLYIEHVLGWVDEQIADENVLPCDEEMTFLPAFRETHAPKIFAKMLRVYAILVVNPVLTGLTADVPPLISKDFQISFRRFIGFGIHWDLLPTAHLDCIKEYVEPVVERYEKTKKEHFQRRP